MRGKSTESCVRSAGQTVAYIGRSRQFRENGYDSYLEHVVARDVAASGQTRDPVRGRRYLETLALSTAGLPTDATL